MQSQYYATSNGFANRVPRQHGPGSQSGFRFSRRTERVDWRKIAAVDLEHITAEGDWSILQQNIHHVTYCNVEQELDLRATDPTFIKLFKLAQMIIEYLMLSQEHLGSVVNSLEEKLSKAVEAQSNATLKIDKQIEEIKEIKMENKRRKKMLATQQAFIQSNGSNYHKCSFCPKAFVHAGYLQSHIDRKHPEQGASIISLSKLANARQEQDIVDLKEKLMSTQRQLEEEKKLYQDSLAQKDASEHEEQREKYKIQIEAISQEQLQTQKIEMDSIRDMFMSELKEMNEKYSQSQHALVDLQQKYGKTSMLGTLQDEDEVSEYKTKLEKQQINYDRLKNHLEEEMTSMKHSMLQEMRTQDKHWKEKNKEAKSIHRKEIERLKEALEEAQATLDVEKEGNNDAITKHYEDQMLIMKKKSKQQDQQLRSRDKEIKQLGNKMKHAVDEIQRLEAVMEASKHMEKSHAGRHTLSPPPFIRTHAPSSTEEEEDTEVDESERVSPILVSPSEDYNQYGDSTLEDSMQNMQDSMFHDTHKDSLDNKTRILEGMKVELDSVLSKNLQKRGVIKNSEGITTQSLDNKLQVLKQERQQLAKKYPKFYNIREKCRRDMEITIKERAKVKKVLSSRPRSSTHRPPRSPSPSSIPKSSSLTSRSTDLTSQHMYAVPKTKHIPPHVALRGSQPPPVVARSPPSPTPRVSSPQKQSFSSDDDISSDEEEDWDSEDSSELTEISPSKINTGANTKPVASNRSYMPTSLQPSQSPDMDVESMSDTGQSTGNIGTKSGGQKVSDLTRSIAFQLSGRSNAKPVGGVDLSGTATSDKLAASSYQNMPISRSPSPQIPTIPDAFDSDDEEDSLAISSFEESMSALQQSKPQPAPRVGLPSGGGSSRKITGDSDISSNTLGTSMWGSSTKGADK